jgi:hypothetical protein
MFKQVNFTALEVMKTCGAVEAVDGSAPRAAGRRNALPDLLMGLDEGALTRLRCLYSESVARDGSSASQEEEGEEQLREDEAGASGSLPSHQPLDRLDVLQSPRYTRRRDAVPDLAAQLGSVDLRNNHCYDVGVTEP